MILTRTVSPAPESRTSTPHNDFGSVYSLPLASLSEPLLPTTNSLNTTTSASKVYRHSKLGLAENRSNLGQHHSSSENSLLGATTAFSSRTSSATSLPLFPGSSESPDVFSSIAESGYISRKRPVHFKSTLRKEKKPDKSDKNVNVVGPQFISEQERKRYEGIWASNHQQDSWSLSSHDARYIDNFIVRELWLRSKLPIETLAHIWYILFLPFILV